MVANQIYKNSRLPYFDRLKGVAIFFVVLGHCLQALLPNWQENNIFLLIYMFHMPLFIIISGYFFYPSVTKHTLKDFSKKKFMHLYLPSLFWGMLQAGMISTWKILNNSTIELGYIASVVFTGAWFLTLLFILNVIGVFIEHFFSGFSIKIWWCIYCCIYVLPTFPMSNELKFLTPFFIIGILWKKYNVIKLSNKIAIVALVVFVLCFHKYNFDYSLYMMDDNILDINYHIKNVIRFLSGISGIVCICYLCKYIPQYMSKPLLYIGAITLPIYVLHQKLLMPIQIFNYRSDNILMVIVVTVACILLSILCYKLLSSFKYLRLFCFGEK